MKRRVDKGNIAKYKILTIGESGWRVYSSLHNSCNPSVNFKDFQNGKLKRELAVRPPIKITNVFTLWLSDFTSGNSSHRYTAYV